MSPSARTARGLAIAAWLLLAASVAAWPFVGAGIGRFATLVAFLPLLLALRGITRGARRSLRFAPMTLAPALALAVTEVLVNPAGRPWAGATLALVFLAFTAVLAALRAAPRD